MSASERKRLEKSGAIRSLRQPPDERQAVAPSQDLRALTMPMPDLQPHLNAIGEMVASVRTATENMASLSAQQVVAMQSSLDRISSAMEVIAEQRSWKKIRVRVDRDRNNDIRDAELTRIE